jgi:hypothetical protein
MVRHLRCGICVDRAASSASASNNRYYKDHLCNQFLASQVTDSRTLGIWLNGYVNGQRGKTLIYPLAETHINLAHYCEDHVDALVLDAAGIVYGVDK